VVSPASAPDYRKNWIECAKVLGWHPDPLVPKKWAWNYNETQTAAHGDCVARKANLAPKPSAQGSRETFTLRDKAGAAQVTSITPD